jgi:hypothetical protein
VTQPGSTVSCSAFNSTGLCAGRQRTCALLPDKTAARWDDACRPGKVIDCSFDDNDCDGNKDANQNICSICRNEDLAQVLPVEAFPGGRYGCGGTVEHGRRGDLCAANYRPVSLATWTSTSLQGAPKGHYWLDEDTIRYFSLGSSCSIAKAGTISLQTECTSVPRPTIARVCAPGLPSNKDAFGNVCAPPCAAAKSVGGCQNGITLTAGTMCEPRQNQ